MGEGTPLEPGRASQPSGFDSLTFPFVPLAERQRCQASNLARRVRLPQGTLCDAG